MFTEGEVKPTKVTRKKKAGIKKRGASEAELDEVRMYNHGASVCVLCVNLAVVRAHCISLWKNRGILKTRARVTVLFPGREAKLF